MTQRLNTFTLVADIGGTNTRVALADGPKVLTKTIRRYANADHTGLEPILRQYVTDASDIDPVAACVAVAGPVRDGHAKMTNLNWEMSEATLAQAINAESVAILNDLQAQGHAVGHIAAENLTRVLTGTPASDTAAKLVIGVGTGFNIAPVIESPGGRMVIPCESGHATLPTRTKTDQELSAFVSKSHGFPAIEDVLSGPGLQNVYAFVTGQDDPTTALTASGIMDACNAGDTQAVKTVEMCVQLLGGVAGNLALTLLPFGGIYFVGGVSRAFAPHLKSLRFQEAFFDKGRFGDFMHGFPVSVVTDDYAALTGCAAYLSQTQTA